MYVIIYTIVNSITGLEENRRGMKFSSVITGNNPRWWYTLGGKLSGKQLFSERPVGSGGHKIWHEPAI